MEVAVVEPALQRDWSGLPAGVLQQIMNRASTWQAPGSCLAAPVCRSWRSAAAGCKDVRLLFFLGHAEAENSFKAWLSQNSPQLGALTLSVFPFSYSAQPVLQALVEAAEAAQAAGVPLPLHTLRVDTACVDINNAGRLLACLPRLRCLQLQLVCRYDVELCKDMPGSEVQAALAPLQAATQLQELYLTGPGALSQEVTAVVAGLLPSTLERLRWWTGLHAQPAAPDLSLQTRVTSLHLGGWLGVTSAKLPPGLRQLELGAQVAPEVLQEQQRVLTGWGASSSAQATQHMGHLTNLKRLALGMDMLASPAVRTALAQHTQLSSLALPGGVEHLPAALAAAGSMRNLRSLELVLLMLKEPVLTGLSTLQQVTQLTMSLHGRSSLVTQEWAAGTVEAIGRMAALRWLSVPGVLLLGNWAPLASLQLLRGLSVCWGAIESPAEAETSMEHLVEGRVGSRLPPGLQVLCVHGISAKQAAEGQCRRLRQVLRGSGCELVVGAYLVDRVYESGLQLAGLPMTLQQALA